MSTVWTTCIWIAQIGIAVEHHRLPETIAEPLVLIAPDGVAVVVSAEAERYGIVAGMSNQGSRGLCEDVRLLPYDRLAYEMAARPIWDLIATESDVVEPFSPEVCYVELRGEQSDVIGRLTSLTEKMAPVIDQPIRIGVAHSKFVALQAAQHRSDTTLLAIPAGHEPRFLAHVPLDALLSYLSKLDRKSRQQLDRLGVRTLGDVWSLSPQRFPKTLQRLGYQMLQLARGFDADLVRPLWPPRTLVAHHSFTDDSADGGCYPDGVADLFVVENRVLKLMEQIGAKLAGGREYTREIVVQVGLLDKTYLVETERLAMPEALVPPLFRAAMRPIQRLQIAQPIVSLEITAGELGSGSGVQLSLMDLAGELPHERAKRLEAAIAFLRQKYGPRVVISGTLLRRVRRLNLWTYSLARYQSDPLEQVATDAKGNPVRFWRRRTDTTQRRIVPHQTKGQSYAVVRIHDRWREAGMRNGTLADSDVWRVETDPYGVSDVQKLDSEWRLTATFD